MSLYPCDSAVDCFTMFCNKTQHRRLSQLLIPIADRNMSSISFEQKFELATKISDDLYKDFVKEIILLRKLCKLTCIFLFEA